MVVSWCVIELPSAPSIGLDDCSSVMISKQLDGLLMYLSSVRDSLAKSPRVFASIQSGMDTHYFLGKWHVMALGFYRLTFLFRADQIFFI